MKEPEKFLLKYLVAISLLAIVVSCCLVVMVRSCKPTRLGQLVDKKVSYWLGDPNDPNEK